MTIEEWAKDFKSYVNELQMPRDDYKGIMEYIDDAIALLKEQEQMYYTLEHDWRMCRELLKEREAVEPKTGHWFKIRGGTAAQCTVCKCWGQINMKFCPWCGAKMET